MKFIDLDAYLQKSQIFYEFLFGDLKFFEKPYFSQDYYRIQLFPLAFKAVKIDNATAKDINDIQKKAVMISTIEGVSPLNLALNYTLLSEKTNSSLQIVSNTGIILISCMY